MTQSDTMKEKRALVGQSDYTEYPMRSIQPTQASSKWSMLGDGLLLSASNSSNAYFLDGDFEVDNSEYEALVRNFQV